MMKKFFILSVAAVALASCSKDVAYQGPQPETDKAQKYDQKFTEVFGTVDSNVNWGFDPVQVIDATGTSNARRAHNVNRNEWGQGGNTVGGHVAVPVNVTPEERTLVYNYFNVKRENAVNQNNINWKYFFVSQVWKGETTYKDGFGNDVLGSDKMNHFQTLKGEGSIDENGNLVGDWEHVNDFNSGNQWSGYGTIEGHTFMENSGTLDFAYHNSVDSKYHNEYIIIPGSEIDASLAGYYYVGFDFYATHPIGQDANKNMDVARDWFFTDWIVRISPAEFIGGTRVMVEDIIAGDLDNTSVSDWDFNDAVFDVSVFNCWEGDFNANKLVALITLRAAGGTVPLYIQNQEVHELFGVPSNTMVNTNAAAYADGKNYFAVDGKAPVTFKIILGDALWEGTYDINDLPIYVGGTQLVAQQGKSTQKFACPTSVKWMKEKCFIGNGYTNFKSYVNNNDPLEWYNTIGQENLLYIK